MSETPRADDTDLNDLLAAYNIAVTDSDSAVDDGSNGGAVEKATDNNFLEPPAAKRSKRKNYVPHKPKRFLEGEEGEEETDGGNRRSLSPRYSNRKCLSVTARMGLENVLIRHRHRRLSATDTGHSFLASNIQLMTRTKNTFAYLHLAIEPELPHRLLAAVHREVPLLLRVAAMAGEP